VWLNRCKTSHTPLLCIRWPHLLQEQVGGYVFGILLVLKYLSLLIFSTILTIYLFLTGDLLFLKYVKG
jgi:hypothetical protein